MGRHRAWLQRWILIAGVCLAGCASQPAATTPDRAADAHWQGKLAVKVYSKPVQAFSATFDLQGRPEKGELTLTSPLGTTLASMQWDAGSATLQANGEQRNYGSLQALAQEVTGADLPVASLFAWLEGRNEAAAGWLADLSDLPYGRIQARHVEEVQAELKIILER